MNDINFEQFIKLLDAALVSDDKKIKTALRKFMFIMALNLSDDDCKPGPFTKMMETIDEVQRRLAAIESKDNTITAPPGTTWPHGIVGSPRYITPSIPSTTSGSSTSTNITKWINNPTATTTAGNFTTTATTTGTATYIINSENENSGTEIKDAIKRSIEKLAVSE